jgi:hypothetical protein
MHSLLLQGFEIWLVSERFCGSRFLKVQGGVEE